MVGVEHHQVQAVGRCGFGADARRQQAMHGFLVDAPVAAIGLPGAQFAALYHLLDGAQRDIEQFCRCTRAVVRLLSQCRIQFHPITRSPEGSPRRQGTRGTRNLRRVLSLPMVD
ncbi:hypothetical protein D9M72_500320 [compost metagenome]